VARLGAEGKQIGQGHVAESRRALKLYIFDDPIAVVPVGRLKRAHVLDFRQRVLDAKGPGVANRALSALKTCLREGYFREELSRDPCMGVGKVNVPKREAGTFTAKELEALFPEKKLGPWLDRQDYTCFLLAATTGLRKSEILALRWRAVDFENKTLRVEEAWKSAVELGRPKWNKVRVTPLPEKTAKALKALRRVSEHVLLDSLVLCYDDGTRLGGTWWSDRFHKAMKAAKTDAKARNLKPNSFRHSLATILADKGQQPEKIRAALGWTNAATQGGYTHWEQTDLDGQATIVDGLFEEKKKQDTVN
jgi:integrase